MGKVFLRIAIFVAIIFAAAYFLCDIKPTTEYGWVAAIWHGLFLIPNLILHLFDKDILFYSDLPTMSYNILFVVGVVLSSLLGETVKIFAQAVKDVKNQQD